MVLKSSPVLLGQLVRRVPLRLIFIVPFVVQIVGAVGLTGWLSIRNGQQAVNDVAMQLRQEVSDRVAYRLDDYLAMPHLINQLNRNTIQRRYLDPNNSAALYQHFFQQAHDFPNIGSIFFGTPEGEFVGNGQIEHGTHQLMIAGPSQGGSIRFYDVDEDGKQQRLAQETPNFVVQQRPWYKAAIAAGQPTWGDIFMYHAFPVLALPASVPVYADDGSLIGVAGNNFFLSQISDFLRTLQVGEHGQIFIVEPSGLLIGSSTPTPLLQVEGNKATRIHVLESGDRLLESTTQALLQEVPSLPQLTRTMQLDFFLDGSRQFVQAVPYRGPLGLQWIIVVVVPESDYMSRIQANTRSTIVLCMAALGLATASGILTSSWLTQPLVRLNDAAKAIALGDFQQYLHPTSGTQHIREVEELSGSFNQMASQLQSSFAEMHALNFALADSESRLRQFLDALPVGIAIHDRSGQLIYTNQLAQDLLNAHQFQPIAVDQLASAFQVYQASTNSLYEPEQMPAIRALQGEFVQTEDLELRRENKTIQLEVRATPIFDHEGKVIYAIAAFQDISQRKQAEEQLIYNALHDTLTDLPNRNLLMSRLELAINWAKQHEDYFFAVLFLDMDRFKVINDSLGHLAGDELLITIAHKLQALIRPTDLAARLGGDEFVLLLDEIEGIQDAVRVAERILQEFRSVFELDGRELFLSTSIGIVMGDRSYQHPSDVLRDADLAMYQAKSSGKATYAVFDAAMHAQALKRLHLENDLRKAIARQEFVVHYQPIVALGTGHIVGFEALVRWQHPTRGLVAPGQFIAIAEETGLVHTIDNWVLRQACTQLGIWQRRFPQLSSLKVTVNLSTRDLWELRLVETLDELLAIAGPLHPGSLMLEITESLLVENVPATIALLMQIRERGIQVSVDDFGTGYSSLSYLHELPIDTLKIDRSFVGQMTRQGKNYRIVETIVQLSNQLGLDAIAEGIETHSQLEYLREFGCEYGQGYLFAQPVTAAVAERLLEDSPCFNLKV
ncbi:EAL domain-containing protein [Leptolyngbya sp. AN02str]|uniref:EAL domain-containing protein n=1 Tax=Leptolyngbya sp. AN02str TaxID=3423363 RepID=UPI003D31E964